jgi:hypothetical protein
VGSIKNNYMCSKQEIKEALEENNKIRDEKWEYRFKVLQEHFKDTAPNKTDINNITQNCAVRGVEIKNTMEKLDSIEKKLDKVLEEKADKTSVETLRKFVTRVLWTSVTSLVGFLIAVIWYLIEKVK